eukprot:TRINITY_DN2763_c0_g1_i4.p1 TRINITY_DN2763_c0_g1~~TRINITY_DN2763_c0_g1_i4.p1  ORF type:complete len:379 (+),score=79.03 TRINITY_DN2763_c0_g1_i4:502-1638(+)
MAKVDVCALCTLLLVIGVELKLYTQDEPPHPPLPAIVTQPSPTHARTSVEVKHVKTECMAVEVPRVLPTPGYPEVNTAQPSLWRVYSHKPPKTMYKTDSEHAAVLNKVDRVVPCGKWVNGSSELEASVQGKGCRGVDEHLPMNGPGLASSAREKVSRCLANHTVLIVGNSLARQWVFSFHKLMTGTNTLRKKQKSQCSYSCGMFLPGPLHVVYIQSLLLWGRPAVSTFEKSGMHNFLVSMGVPFGIKPTVVVAGFGHQDAFEPGDPLQALRKLACHLLRLVREGVTVLYRTAVPLRRFFTQGMFGNSTFISEINKKVAAINSEARRLFKGSGVAILDEEAAALDVFAQGADSYVYEDHIHPPAVNTVMLRETLHVLCS